MRPSPPTHTHGCTVYKTVCICSTPAQHWADDTVVPVSMITIVRIIVIIDTITVIKYTLVSVCEIVIIDTIIQ